MKLLRFLYYHLLFFLCAFANNYSIAQIRLTIPTGPALNISFGNGNNNSSLPLSQSHTDFIYTSNPSPASGYYTVIKKPIAHSFIGPAPFEYNNDSNYSMYVTISPSLNTKMLFTDTINNLCGSTPYLFWANINPAIIGTSCFYPNFNFIAETINGIVLQTFQTGDIGSGTDNASYYPGFWSSIPPPPLYYGLTFNLPSNENSVVLKIIQNPSAANTTCRSNFYIDNIFLSAAGPKFEITTRQNPDFFFPAVCSQDTFPFIVNSSIDNGYLKFGSNDFIPFTFKDPAIRWQQSFDNGYKWNDISNETGTTLSRLFNTPDTFYLRARASENNNINNKSCSVISNVLKVFVEGKPEIFDITSNSPVCEDSDIVLNVSGGATYITTGPDGFYDNSSYPHVYHPQLSDSGWYTTKIISRGGCYVYDSTYVKVIGPNLQVSVNPDSVCYGKTVQLFASGGSSYLWSPSKYLSNPEKFNPLSKPLNTIKYTVKAIDEIGCSAFSSITIKVRDSILKAAFNSNIFICPNDVAAFTDTSIGAVKQWFWSFGNGETSTQKNPSSPHYTFGNNLKYLVQLIVTDTAGCADTTVKFIKAVSNCYIAVPSAFTPNNDGLNDYLYPLNAYKATNLIFKVFNRFGEPVFETTDWTKKWDGTINSIPQPAGTYVWILNYTDEKNQRINLKGTTVLLR